MTKIKEYVFKKKPETKLEEKKEIVIDIEEEKEKKIIANLNNQELKSFYEKKVILYNCIGIFLLIFGLFIILNTILYIFNSQIINLFIYKNESLWRNLFGFAMGNLMLIGAVQYNKKVKKYEQLLKELT